jgi:predicted Zn finger-like uncharacterized protein
MKITCQSCQSKYNVADEKVQGKIVKIRCRKCGATIVVHGTGGATANGSTPAPEPPAPPVSDAQWHVNLGETDQRAMSLAELMDAYNSGVVTQDTFIWTDGMDDWKPLAEVETVVEALHASAGSPAVAAAPAGFSFEPPATQQPSAIEPPTAFDVPAFAAPYADQAAAAAPAHEAKRAAVRREARGRDLFGGGGGFGGGEEVQTSAPSMPQGMTPQDDVASKMTGERNENSVLFSLAVLTKNADERAPSQPPPYGSNEDSGLIDLKALAARAESARPPSMADGGMFASPIGISSPLGPSDLGSPFGVGEAPRKSKLPLIIGGVAGGLLLVVLGLVLGAKISAISAAPAASAVAPPATTSAEPVATASAPTAEASASAAPSASVAAKPKPVYHAPAGGAIKPVAGGGAAAASSGGAAAGASGAGAATPPPPKKQGSDCGCNGDLMCLMKCSTH